MTYIKRQPPIVVLFICAAIAAQFSLAPVYAAVPIEESVEDSSREGQPLQPVQDPVQEPRASQRARSLDIPPTIEPTVNSDYGSAPARTITQQPISTTSSGASQGQLSELFYQLQILQQEIQDLRGQVEEQTYLVNRLQRDQKEQYLDLDRRLVAYSENQPAPGPSSTAPVASTVPLQSGNLTEREAYTQAFEAMRAREFDSSMAGFQRLIETYPNGQYTPNAYYWIGELQLVAKSDPELARQSFAQVVSLYPDHNKAPDAMYKLGVVYHNLGDITTALSFLERVQNEHPSSPAAGLAAKYAAELK